VLLFAARRLIAALAGWLAVRNGALRGIELHLGHAQGACTERVPAGFQPPVHAAPRIERVLKERLDALRLPAPVLSLRLCAAAIESRPAGSQVLFDGAGRGRRRWPNCSTACGAAGGRGGAGSGLPCRPSAGAGQPARLRRSSAAVSSKVDSPPRPLWLLESPPKRCVKCVGDRRGGELLALLAGPERIESGWWDGADARRDYFVAIDRRAPGCGFSAIPADPAAGSCTACFPEAATAGYVDTAVCRVIHG
jgi:protein ImuB